MRTVVTHAAELTRYFKNNRFLIAFSLFWFAGILAGFGLFHLCKPFVFLQMRSAVLQPVSIVGLFCSIFLPLFCTYISVLINRPIIVLVVCFFKAASFCFSFSCVSALYDTASWLLYMLFMFSDSCFLLILFFLWLRYPYNYDAKSKRIFCFSILVALLIIFGDYFIVSPFLIGLF